MATDSVPYDQLKEMSFEEFDGLNLRDLAAQQAGFKADVENYERLAKEAKKKFDYLRKIAIPNKMDEMGVEGINLTDIGRVSLRSDLYAGIKKDQQGRAYQWLADNGFEDLVKDYVHYSTLKAFLNERLKEGDVELPEDIFTAEPYTYAAISKK